MDERQSRERAVPCRRCGRATWAVNAVCDQHEPPRWVVEQRVMGSWVACGHGPYDTKAEAEAEFATIVGSGLTAGPFRVQPVQP